MTSETIIVPDYDQEEITYSTTIRPRPTYYDHLVSERENPAVRTPEISESARTARRCVYFVLRRTG